MTTYTRAEEHRREGIKRALVLAAGYKDHIKHTLPLRAGYSVHPAPPGMLPYITDRAGTVYHITGAHRPRLVVFKPKCGIANNGPEC
jgi:hypothetical protein